MRLIPGNAQHIGSRQQQQDAFGFSNLSNEAFRKHGGLLAVVADGMGGMAHGDAASRAALKAFLEAYENKTEAESIPDALLRAIQSSNAAVFQLAMEMGSAEEMGTTLIAVAVQPDKMHWVSAGDSGIFLYRDGEYTQINSSHTYAIELDEQVSQGEISRAQALAHPERESLTSFLGLERLSQLDRSIRPFALQESDVVLLASDGLFKTLTFAEMAEAMDGDAQQIAEALVSRTIAAEKQYQDNVTVIAISAEKERPSIAALPTLPSRAAVIIPKRRVLPMVLAIVALLVAGSYIYYMFSYDPAKAKGTVKAPAKELPRVEEPGREGEGLDPKANPELQRQPKQNPPTPAPEPREEPPGEQKK